MVRVFLRHVLPFFLGCFVGVVAFYLSAPFGVPVPANMSGPGWGSGESSCRLRHQPRWTSSATLELESGNRPFVITSKPRATYTDLARENNTEGSVLLRVTLLANGKVGDVVVVRGLPDGLTERAIEAARQIEFVPKKVKGVPTAVTQTLEYTFDIY